MEIVNQIVMKKISEVKPYVRNPRKNDKTVNLLVEIIPKVGFNVPLVIDRNGIIVKGHARYAAAIRLGMEEIPCVVTDADEETIKLDRLADNRISEFSEWINDELLHEIDMLNLDFDFDLESLGFPAPSDDFDADALFDDGVVGESEEDRRARYQAYLDTVMVLENGEKEDDDMDKATFTELFREMRKDLQDNDCSDWSEAARQWAVNNGIVQGGAPLPDGSANFMWQDMMTREQLVTVLYRFAQKLGMI